MMDKEEIEKQLFADPEKFFQFYQKNGINFESLKEIDLPKSIIKRRFPELLKEKDYEAAETLFWVAYYAERELRNMILFVEQSQGKDIDKTEQKIDDMTFGQKIQFVEENYNNLKEDRFTKLLKTIKELRNHLAHGRLDKLVYKNYSFSDPRAATILFADLRNATKVKAD